MSIKRNTKYEAKTFKFRYPEKMCIRDSRKNLYRRIDLRVDQMIEDGLVAEVKALKARGYDRSMVSMQGLGYKEILDYLDLSLIHI